MYQLVICRTTGFAIEHWAAFGPAMKRFNDVISDPDTTTIAIYAKEGNQINAYADPEQFKTR